MKAITTSGWGLSAQLVLKEVSGPGKPGPDDVLVRVHAASVNPKDWKLNYHAAVAFTPLVMNRAPPFFGDDLAGVVIDRGSRVRDFEIGDAVYGMDMRPRTASLAEVARIDQKRIAGKPSSLTFQQGAAMPLAAQTALQGLRKGMAESGKSVLIIGASGGVGSFAVQIARAWGLQVTGVCSGRNADFVRQLGGHEVIDYTEGDYRKSSGPFDLVFDVTSHESPRTCEALIAEDGWFISTGGDARSMLLTPFYQVFGKHCGTVVVESWTRDLDALSALVERGELTPVIDSVFTLAESQKAYDRSRTGRCRGKVVIDVESTGS